MYPDPRKPHPATPSHTQKFMIEYPIAEVTLRHCSTSGFRISGRSIKHPADIILQTCIPTKPSHYTVALHELEDKEKMLRVTSYSA